MKIFANKEIKKLFLAVSVIWVASLLLTQGFLWLCYQRFSLFLLLVFVLAGGAILAVGCSYTPAKRIRNMSITATINEL